MASRFAMLAVLDMTSVAIQSLQKWPPKLQVPEISLISAKGITTVATNRSGRGFFYRTIVLAFFTTSSRLYLLQQMALLGFFLPPYAAASACFKHTSVKLYRNPGPFVVCSIDRATTLVSSFSQTEVSQKDSTSFDIIGAIHRHRDSNPEQPREKSFYSETNQIASFK